MTENIKYPEWRQLLARSLHLHRSKAEAKYFQLASTDCHGKAHVRTVVFRGFVDNANKIAVVTDTRSEKYQHLSANPAAELCWYFAKTREQYRIAFEAQLYDINASASCDVANKKLSQAWNKLSEKAKMPFYGAAPGIPFDEAEQGQQATPSETLASSFCLIELSPKRVDYLDLKPDIHTRIEYLESENWLPKQIQA